MAVCLRGGLMILTTSTNVCKIYFTFSIAISLNIDYRYQSDASSPIRSHSFTKHYSSFQINGPLLWYTHNLLVPFSRVLPDSSSDLLSFSESVRVRAEFSWLDTPELRRDFTLPRPAHSWMALSGDSGPSGSESASEPALREYPLWRRPKSGQ